MLCARVTNKAPVHQIGIMLMPAIFYILKCTVSYIFILTIAVFILSVYCAVGIYPIDKFCEYVNPTFSCMECLKLYSQKDTCI